jgi:antitoxin Phd
MRRCDTRRLSAGFRQTEASRVERRAGVEPKQLFSLLVVLLIYRGQSQATAKELTNVLNLLTIKAVIAIIATMKSVTALEAKNRFGEVLEAAQRQPVSITRNGRPSVVMISAESYARRQKMASERLRLAMRRAGEHAAAQGMSEDVLGQLLADES